MQSALGGDDHFAAAIAQGCGDQLFALPVAAVHVGGIEMIDAHLEAGANRGEAFVVV